MAIAKIENVRISGIACALPQKTERIRDISSGMSADEIEKIISSIGVEARRTASSLCSSDLCFAAAEELILKMDYDRSAIGGVIFVSQTPDYILPATSHDLHRRLELSKSSFAFDVNLGCSGYVYGLWLASTILKTSRMKSVLLLTGDTMTRICSPGDRSVRYLFGDAGSATIVESCEDGREMNFVLGADGGGVENLIVKAGGFRTPVTPETKRRVERESGNIRSDEDLFMDGAEIFSFTLREVPGLIEAVMSASGWEKDAVDAYVMHQANKFIIEYLGKKARLPKEKILIAMKDYGNTSVASIPVTIVDSLRGVIDGKAMKLLLCGFGVGFSWAAVTLHCGPIVVPGFVEVPEPVGDSK